MKILAKVVFGFFISLSFLSAVQARNVAINFSAQDKEYTIGDTISGVLTVDTEENPAIGVEMQLTWSDNVKLVKAEKTQENLGCDFTEIKKDDSLFYSCFGELSEEGSLIKGYVANIELEVIDKGEIQIDLEYSFGDEATKQAYLLNKDDKVIKGEEVDKFPFELRGGSLIALGAFAIIVIVAIFAVKFLVKKLSGKIGKKKATIVSMFVMITLVGSLSGIMYLLLKDDTKIDERSEASEKETIHWYVYPSEGNCTTNSKTLNTNCWEGGIGIQQAIDAIPDDGTNKDHIINIMNGTYTRTDDGMKVRHLINTTGENRYDKCFIYNEGKSLQLIGESQQGVILDGENSNESTGLCIHEGTVKVDKITVNGFKDIGESCDPKTVVSGCGRGYGIYLSGESQVVINESTINNNGSIGIILLYTSNATISGSTISNNGNYGIGLWDTSNATISGSTISNNGNHGIALCDTSNATISGSTISDNGSTGIGLWDTSNATISGSTISNNGSIGIALYDTSNAVIKGNILKRNYYEAIGLENCDTARIINNTIVFNCESGDRPGGISLYRSCDATIKNNIIAFNNATGIFRNATVGNESLHTGTFDLSYNNVYGNQTKDYSGGVFGEGGLSADPLFVDKNNGNFRLKPTSPSKNTGDPTINNPDGSRSDMGAYGGADACLLDQTIAGCDLVLPDLSQGCNIDTDCIYKPAQNCCNCANGGTEVAILKSKENEYNTYIDSLDCENIECATVYKCEYYENIAPICNESTNKCELKSCASFIDLDCNNSTNMVDYSLFVTDYLAFKRRAELNRRSDLAKSNPSKVDMADYSKFVIEYLRIRRAN